MTFANRGACRLLIGVLIGSVLGGCANPDVTGDLRQFVADVKARPPGKIEPYPEPKPVELYVYVPDERRDPFSPARAVREETEVLAGTGISPDPNRRKEELEQFALDSLLMVGTLEQQEMRWGLVKNRAGLLYRVRPGNYMGQNHGQINAITEGEIILTEIVPNGMGGFRERDASVALAQ